MNVERKEEKRIRKVEVEVMNVERKEEKRSRKVDVEGDAQANRYLAHHAATWR